MDFVLISIEILSLGIFFIPPHVYIFSYCRHGKSDFARTLVWWLCNYDELRYDYMYLAHIKS